MATTHSVHIRRMEGWLVSFVLHGLVLSATLPLFRHVPLVIPPEPFRWDVTLVQSTQLADEPPHAAEPAEQTMVTSTESVAPLTTAKSPAQIAESYAETPDPPITETAVTANTRLKSPSPILSPSDTATGVQETTPAHHNIAEEPAPSIPTLDDHLVTVLQTSDPPIHQTKTATASMPQEQPSPATVAASSSNTTDPGSDSIQPAQPRVVTPVHTGSSSETRPDYGWLQRAIFQRLEELKRSSRPWLDQSHPLKVLVKAVVSNEGTLMEAEVVKSSGLDRIDQEAMMLVQRAFPMKLDRTLDRSQIVMRIPITYSRD